VHIIYVYSACFHYTSLHVIVWQICMSPTRPLYICPNLLRSSQIVIVFVLNRLLLCFVLDRLSLCFVIDRLSLGFVLDRLSLCFLLTRLSLCFLLTRLSLCFLLTRLYLCVVPHIISNTVHMNRLQTYILILCVYMDFVSCPACIFLYVNCIWRCHKINRHVLHHTHMK
jgi:hypothetical protein